MRRWGHILVLLAIVATTIGCDQVSKHVASSRLMGTPGQSFLGDAFRLEYAENTGAFLSLGEELPAWLRMTLFSFGPAVVLTACLVSAFRNRWPRPALLGVCFFFAGGASNLIDRVIHGRVVDFLNVGIGPVRTGIFNVADMAIMLGAALLIWRHQALVNDDQCTPTPTGQDTPVPPSPQ
jgi:signal peptidase II